MAQSKYHSITVQGLTLKIEKNVLDDIDVLEQIGEMQDGNPFAFAKLAKKLFGNQYDKVKNHLAVDGRTTATAMANFFTEVLTAVEAVEAKN